jgi:RNA polymerase sigma-70 factor, ECF subfamily
MSPAQKLAALRPQLLSFAVRRLQNRERAEDAVQETLLAALEGLERFAGASSLNTWVTGILKHKITDTMRASRREEPIDVDDHAGLPGSDPEEHFARSRFFETLERSLKRLPEAAVHVFMLRAVMECDTGEVCERLAISPANCWVMLHRARSRLRDCPELRGLAADAL